jgi:hypothetical protein
LKKEEEEGLTSLLSGYNTKAPVTLVNGSAGRLRIFVYSNPVAKPREKGGER